MGVNSPINSNKSTVELKKSTASPDLTVSGKDLSNPLMGGYSPMNIKRYIVGSEIPTTSLDQTVSSKDLSNLFMAGNLPKISQKGKEVIKDALSQTTVQEWRDRKISSKLEQMQEVLIQLVKERKTDIWSNHFKKSKEEEKFSKRKDAEFCQELVATREIS